MSSQPPETAEDVIDPAVARAERRLAVLQRLTEIGMELVEALRDRVIEGQADGEEGRVEVRAGDTADAFARLSRAGDFAHRPRLGTVNHRILRLRRAHPC